MHKVSRVPLHTVPSRVPLSSHVHVVHLTLCVCVSVCLLGHSVCAAAAEVQFLAFVQVPTPHALQICHRKWLRMQRNMCVCVCIYYIPT